MKISLIITTYNWKEALAAVLESVCRQTLLPDEIVIADDGSRSDTADLIAEYQKKLTVPLIHSWQEDQGFRVAMSRNRAFAKSSGDYIIMIDGDMVLSPKFIESYRQAVKKPGWFIQGGRVLANKECSDRIILQGYQPSFFSRGIRNRKNCLSNHLLSKIFSFERNNAISTRSCNMGIWRSDLIEVNGFNNKFFGWGREDSEFVIRLLNAGKRRLYLKFAGVGYHLYHAESSKESLPENDRLLNLAISNKLITCEDGLERFLTHEN